MNSDLYLFSGPSAVYLVLSLISIAMATLLSGKKNVPGTGPLMWCYIGLFIWAFSYVFESAALNIHEKLVWSQIAYLGTVSTPVFLFAFSQQYSSRIIIKKRSHWGIAFIIPFLTLLFAWTNEKHHWVWSDIQIGETNNLAIYSHGFWFWIFFIFAYIFLLTSLVILLQAAFKLRKVYRSQAILIISACLMIMVGNILYLIPSNPIPGMEWTLVGLIFSSLILAFGILRFKLFDLVPEARSTLVEIMSEGIILTDGIGRIKDLNPSFLKFMEADPSLNYIGKDIANTFEHSPEILEILNRENEDLLISPEIKIGTRVLKIDVTEVNGHSSATNGKLLVVNDITAFKKSEEALHKSNEILSLEVAKGQKLIDELDAFAQTVAHDLKTPLNGLAGFSELLSDNLKEGRTEDSTQLSDLINQSAYKMVHIVEELLLLTSVRSESVRKSNIKMESIFDSAVQRLETLIIDKQVVMTTPKEWPLIKGYGPWIEEIWVNYLSNAIKYGGTPPVIDIFTNIEDNYIWFNICDNGQGVPEKLMSKLFLPFSRLATHKTEGHGLGLSIIKRITDKLDGKVKVENRSGTGACFSFALPLVKNN